jgi:hypothetical protein
MKETHPSVHLLLIACLLFFKIIILKNRLPDSLLNVSASFTNISPLYRVRGHLKKMPR